ncbi:MAG: uracil-DNA glycosylase [Gammaproteobacteria bacterium]|nr:uracil-DNA glycosylase [Gammaproteobacteria bacterium]
MAHVSTYRENCRKCSRLARHLTSSKKRYPAYHCKPVAAFGDQRAQLLVVGLAPGLHGANATGRPFTGDHAGILLYQTLYKFGFSSRPSSESSNDSLQLKNCRITNAVKCLPPANKPTTEEIRNCNGYLHNELKLLEPASVVLALGKIAHDAVLRALALKLSRYPFAHGERHSIGYQLHLLDSYHCSRYNTQTRRLTQEQFEAVFSQAVSLLAEA